VVRVRAIDIEDKKRAETALRKSETQLAEAQRELQLTIDTIPALVVTFQPMVMAGFRQSNMAEITPALLCKIQPVKVDPTFILTILREPKTRGALHWRNGEPFLIELRLRGSDGKYRWHTIRRVPLRDENGDIVKWYGVAFDTRTKKTAENALHAAQTRSGSRQPRRDFGRNRRDDCARGESSACHHHHERREPPCVGWLEPEPHVREGPGTHQAHGCRCTASVRDHRPHPRHGGPARTRADGCLSLGGRYRGGRWSSSAMSSNRKASRFALRSSAGASQVNGDPSPQLQQVVVNLAINATQALAKSETARRSISIRTMQPDPETVCCIVEDSGPGIDPTHLASIF